MGRIISTIPQYDGAGVYALVDEAGKKYIGSSQNVALRVLQHQYNLHRAACNSTREFKGTKLETAAHNGHRFRAILLEKLPPGGSRYDLWDLERKHLEAAGGIAATYNGAPIEDHRKTDYNCFYLWNQENTSKSKEIASNILSVIKEREAPVTDDTIVLAQVGDHIPVWSAEAKAQGVSLQQFIINAVEAAIGQNDNNN